MAAIDDLTAFAQSIYLVIKDRYFDGITGADGQTYLQQVVDWTNMFLDELETEVDPEGNPIDWTWARSDGERLGTARQGKSSVDFDLDDFLNLIAEEGRYVQIVVGGAVVSNWAVVAPSQITSKTDRITEDMVALVGGSLVFSRAFLDYEDTGTIIGDVTAPLPRLTYTLSSGNVTNPNVDLLTTVRPKTLLILGVAKNATLPDIVQGGLSPSYAQKYNDLLQNAIARSLTSSVVDTAARDDYSGVGGVGF